MKNIQRGIVIPILLAIIGFLLVGGGVYLYLQYNQKQISSTLVNSQMATSSTQSPTNTQAGTQAVTVPVKQISIQPKPQPDTKNHSIVVLSPKEGEQISKSGTFSVTWKASNFSSDARVDLYLIFPNGASHLIGTVWTAAGIAALEASSSPVNQYLLSLAGGSTIESGAYTWTVNNACSQNQSDLDYCSLGASYRVAAYILPQNAGSACDEFGNGRGCTYWAKGESNPFTITQ